MVSDSSADVGAVQIRHHPVEYGQPRRIAGFSSEVLVLGALDEAEGVVLLRPDKDAAPGSRIA